jgi:hypothetical protein
MVEIQLIWFFWSVGVTEKRICDWMNFNAIYVRKFGRRDVFDEPLFLGYERIKICEEEKRSDLNEQLILIQPVTNTPKCSPDS